MFSDRAWLKTHGKLQKRRKFIRSKANRIYPFNPSRINYMFCLEVSMFPTPTLQHWKYVVHDEIYITRMEYSFKTRWSHDIHFVIWNFCIILLKPAWSIVELKQYNHTVRLYIEFHAFFLSQLSKWVRVGGPTTEISSGLIGGK